MRKNNPWLLFFLSFLAAMWAVGLACLSAEQFDQGQGFPKRPGSIPSASVLYYVQTNDSSVPNARALTFASPQFSTSDAGPGNTFTVSPGTVLSYFYSTGATTNQTALNAITNLSGTAAGDIYYRSALGTVSRLAIGSNGDLLTVSGGMPAWQAGAAAAPGSAQYIVGALDGTLSAERVWTDGSGISHTDGGANGAWTVGVDSTVIRTTGAQSLAGPKTLSGGPIISGAHTNGIVFRCAAFDNTIKSADISGANRITTFPNAGADATVLVSEGALTVNGEKNFTDLKINATTFKSGANTMTVPSSSQTLVGETNACVMTNKELTSPDFTSNATGFRMKSSGGGNYIHTWAAIAADRTITWSDPNGNVDVAYKSGACAAGGIAYGIGNNTVSVTSAGSSGQPLLSGGSGAPTFGTLGQSVGGTAQTTWTAGDILTVNDAGTLVKLAGGSDGNVLTYDSTGNPNIKWAAGSSGTVTSFSATPTGIFDVATATTTPALSLDNQNANLILAGPSSGGAATPSFRSLVVADGATGITTYTTGDILYCSSANTLSKLAIGSTGNQMEVSGGIPSWAVAKIRTIEKASDEIVNNSATIQDDNDFTMAVAANTTYTFTLNCIHTHGNASGDFDFTFTVPTGSTIDWWAENPALTLINEVTASGTEVTENTAAATYRTTITGFVTTAGTSGNLLFRWAQNAANASDCTVQAGSTFTVIRK